MAWPRVGAHPEPAGDERQLAGGGDRRAGGQQLVGLCDVQRDRLGRKLLDPAPGLASSSTVNLRGPSPQCGLRGDMRGQRGKGIAAERRCSYRPWPVPASNSMTRFSRESGSGGASGSGPKRSSMSPSAIAALARSRPLSPPAHATPPQCGVAARVRQGYVRTIGLRLYK